MVRLAKRTAAAAFLLVALALTALPLAGDGAVGAAQPESGVVKCQTFSETYALAVVGFSLAGCTDPANTGGSGQGSQISVTPTSQTVLITWAAGGTTTISVTFAQTTYRVRDCGPQMSEFGVSEGHLTGQVTADTTGSIKLKTVRAKVCIHSFRALATLGNVPRTPFKL
jgi:hypothetical protein